MFSSHFLLSYFPILSVEGCCRGPALMWGEGEVVSDHVFCALCRNWEVSKGHMEGYCQAQDDHGWCQAQDIPQKSSILEKGLGVGRVEVCAEGTEVTGNPATAVGITLPSVVTCCGGVISFLPWWGSGLGSCPKVWNMFIFLQSNNNRNVCLKLVWQIIRDDFLGLPALGFLFSTTAQRLGTFHHQRWGMCSLGVFSILCSLFLISHLNTNSSFSFCPKELQSCCFSLHQLTFFGLILIFKTFPFFSPCRALFATSSPVKHSWETWYRAGEFASPRGRVSTSCGAFGWVKDRRDENKPRATSS